MKNYFWKYRPKLKQHFLYRVNVDLTTTVVGSVEKYANSYQARAWFMRENNNGQASCTYRTLKSAKEFSEKMAYQMGCFK